MGRAARRDAPPTAAEPESAEDAGEEAAEESSTPTQGTIKREHLKASLVVVHVAA